MNIDELNEEYEKDAVIDTLNLDEELRRAPLLHAKYLRKWAVQRYKLEKYKADMKKLRVEKFEFYSHGPSKEDKAKGKKLPPSGMILKTNVPMYLDGDEDVLEVQSCIDNTQILVDELKEIISTLAYRAKNLETILLLRKFEAGI